MAKLVYEGESHRLTRSANTWTLEVRCHDALDAPIWREVWEMYLEGYLTDEGETLRALCRLVEEAAGGGEER